MKTRTNILIIVIPLIIVGCGNPHQQDIRGTIKEQVYENTYFGITLHFDSNWYPIAHKQSKELMKEGVDKIKKDNPKYGQSHYSDLIEKELKKVVHLIGLHKVKNPYLKIPTSFILTAHKANPEHYYLLSGENYLYNLIQNFTKQRSEYHLIRGPYQIMVGEQLFSRIDFRVYYAEQIAYQSFVATKTKQYIIFFVMTAQKTSDFEEMEKMLNNIRFSKNR